MKDIVKLIEENSICLLRGGRNHSVFFQSNEDEHQCIKVFQKNNERRARNEWIVLNFLHDCGVEFVPKPIRFIEESDCFIIVMEFLKGIRLDDVHITKIELTALRNSMDILYSLPPKSSSYTLGSVNCNSSCMLSRVQIFFMNNNLSTRFRDNTEAWELLRSWVFGKEADELKNIGNQVFSRGDHNLSNSLWDNGILRFVDFEYSGWSDKAFDIADLVEHVNSRRINDELWNWFISQFNLTMPEVTRLRTSRKLLSIYWLSKFWFMNNDDEDQNKFDKQFNRVMKLIN